MAVSQNGWKALDRSLIASYAIPGGRITMRKGDVSVVLSHVAHFVHGVEPLLWPGCWGFAERNVRLGSSISNHGSGTAIDLSAPRHPLGVRGTWTQAEKDRIHAMLRNLEGVVRWGEDYKSRVDGMHFEIVGSAAAVKRVADKLRARTKAPVQLPAYRPGSRTLLPAAKVTTGTDVQALQRWIGAEPDGRYGPQSVAATKRVQTKVGVPATGIVDATTWAHYEAWVKWTADKAKAKEPAKPAAPAAPPPGRPALPKLGAYTPKLGLSRARNAAARHGGVEKAQRNLAILGLYRLASDQPGRFGDDTERAVKELQRRRGLAVDGVIGPRTWAALQVWS